MNSNWKTSSVKDESQAQKAYSSRPTNSQLDGQSTRQSIGNVSRSSSFLTSSKRLKFGKAAKQEPGESDPNKLTKEELIEYMRRKREELK